MKGRVFVATIGFIVFAALAAQVGDAWARAGSGGSRGSRSYSAPARPSTPLSPTTQSSPSRSLGQPAPAPSPMAPQRPSMFRNVMTGLAGFAIGGLLGSLLFGGMRGFGGGIGFFDILLIGGAVLMLIMFLRRRRSQTAEPAYAPAGAPTSAYGSSTSDARSMYTGAGGSPVVEMPAADADRGDVERGVGFIRQMDPSFEPFVFGERARADFANVQSALATRDMTVLSDRLAPELYASLQRQCEELKRAGRTNYVQKIDLERSEISEAWQENGSDFVTVYFAGTLIDYTVDDGTGAVVEGSKTEPTKIEEFWTFARPVGPNRWKVTAIQTS